MKKLVMLLPVALVSISAYSQPYIVAGYGVGSMSHDETLVFTDTATNAVNTILKPDSSDSAWHVALGYRAENNLGLEVGYQQFEADASREIFVAYLPAPDFAIVDNNWKAEIKAKRMSIKPVLFINLDERFTLKTGLGLTYTEYKISGYSYQETDRELADFETYLPIANVTNPVARTEKEVGVLASIGLEYNLWKGVTLGVDGQVGYDKIATTAQLFGTVGYQF